MIRRALPGLLAALLLLFAAGCGGDDGNDPTEGSGMSGEPAAAAPEAEGTAEAAQRFGSAASEERQAEVVDAMRDYFGAIATGHLRRACGHLSRSYRSAAAAGPGGRGGGGCRTLARTLRGGAAADRGAARRNAAAEIVRVGVEGGTAVVVFRPEQGPTSFLTLVREGGSWRLTSLTAAPLPKEGG